MNKKTVFVVVEDSTYDYSTELFVFDNIEKAIEKKNELIEKSGIRDEMDDDYECIDEEEYFEAYPDGEYCENHYVVYIKKEEVR